MMYYFQVQTIRQGYLSKRSSNLRGDWKRRFFVLDSRGMLYYYRKQITKPPVCPPRNIFYLNPNTASTILYV